MYGKGYQNMSTLSCRLLASPHIELFQKIRGLELASLPHFLHSFWRKMILVTFYYWPNFIVWLPLLCERLGNMCIAIICKPCCDVMNFEANLIFLIMPFFQDDQIVVTKTKISWERKKLLRWNKHFSSLLRGFQSSKWHIFLEGESPTLILKYLYFIKEIYAFADDSITWGRISDVLSSFHVLKVGLSPSKKIFYLLDWKPLKKMKNAFSFILKAHFVLKMRRLS